MLETQKFLRLNSLEELQAQFAIKVKRHPEFPNLCHFSYSQYDSPRYHPVVRECRSLILDEANDWTAVSYPYKRWFNYDEGCADVINWSTASCHEKVDGSILILWPYEGEWYVSTSGTPDASPLVNDGTCTYSQLFWRTWEEMKWDLPAPSVPACFMFELMTPHNRVVVKHEDCKLVLHGARDLNTLQELDPEEVAEYYGWECVKRINLSSLEDIIAATNNIDGSLQEGFIVRDVSFNRLKFKSADYLRRQYSLDTFTTRRLLRLVAGLSVENFLELMPELTEEWKEVQFYHELIQEDKYYFNLFEELKETYEQLISYLEAEYSSYANYTEFKDLAIATKNHEWGGLIMSLRRGKLESVREGLVKMSFQYKAFCTYIEKLEKALGLREEIIKR